MQVLYYTYKDIPSGSHRPPLLWQGACCFCMLAAPVCHNWFCDSEPSPLHWGGTRQNGSHRQAATIHQAATNRRLITEMITSNCKLALKTTQPYYKPSSHFRYHQHTVLVDQLKITKHIFITAFSYYYNLKCRLIFYKKEKTVHA